MNPVTVEWLTASKIDRHPEWHSTPMKIKPLLIALDFRSTATIGWYFGEPLNQWRMEGSPSEMDPTHWMPLPELP